MMLSAITMINASTSSKAKKNGAPAKIQKKVQEIITVHCLNWVYMLPSMKLDDLHKTLSSAYHGDEKAGIISFSEQYPPELVSSVAYGIWKRMDLDLVLCQ
jgi:hypothetical protein